MNPLLALGTFARPELARVSLRYAIQMALRGTLFRQWYPESSAQAQFLFDNAIGLSCFLTAENTLADVISRFIDGFWDGPLGSEVLFIGCRFIAPRPSALFNFLFCHREEFPGQGFVVTICGDGRIKELTVFTTIAHVFDDFRDELLVFFFRVLLIEDAVLRLAEPEASEAIADRRETTFAVEKIGDVIPTMIGEDNLVHAVSSAIAFVHKLAVEAEHAKVVRVFRAVHDFIAIRAVFEIA